MNMIHFNEVTAAQGATATYAVQGILSYLAPEKTSEAYGLKNCDKFAILISEEVGAGLLSSAIAWYCILLHDIPATKAIGLGLLAIVTFNFQTLLNGIPSEIGFSATGNWIHVTLSSFVSHALLTESSYANTAAKFYAVYLFLTCLRCRLNPDAAFPEASANAKLWLKCLGHDGAGLAVFIGSIASGMDPILAIGVSCIPAFLSTIAFLFGDSLLDELGLSKTPSYIWAVIFSGAFRRKWFCSQNSANNSLQMFQKS